MKKQGKNLYVVIIILAVVVLGLGATCIYAVVSQNIPSINAVKHEGKQEEDSDSGEGSMIEQNMNGFTISSNGSVTQEDTDTNTADSQVNSSEYLCDYSSTRLLKKNDIKDIIKNNKESLPKDKSVPQMMINEIYARHGCEFDTKEIQEYFDQKDWYKSITDRESDKNKLYEAMSKTEKKNIKMLQDYK